MWEKGNCNIYGFEMLDRAHQFKKTSEILKNMCGMGIAFEVNCCFACELYLKYLLNFDGGKKEEINSTNLARGHGLKDFYKKLDEDAKQAIGNKMKIDVEQKLEEVGLNFERARYEYEYEKATFSPDFLFEFMNVLSEISKF